MNYWLMPNIKGVSLVNQALGLPNGEIKSKRGRRQDEDSNITLKRACAMKLLKDSGLTHKKVAKRMNIACHSSVIRAVQKVNNFLSINDEQTQLKLKEVKEILTTKYLLNV